MKKLGKDAVISTVVAATALSVIAGSSIHKALSYQDIRTEMREAARKQEETLGIKHFGEPDFLFVRDDRTGVLARKNRVGLDTIKFRNDSLPLASYDPIDNRFIIVAFDTNPNIAKQQKFHEWIHFYNHQLLKKMGYKDGIAPEGYKTNKGLRLVVEGIAENLSVRSKGVETYPIRLDSVKFYDRLAKEGMDAYTNVGYLVVTRALNKNINRGIEVLTQNPPTDEELKDLAKYEEKILRMMEERK